MVFRCTYRELRYGTGQGQSRLVHHAKREAVALLYLSRSVRPVSDDYGPFPFGRLTSVHLGCPSRGGGRHRDAGSQCGGETGRLKQVFRLFSVEVVRTTHNARYRGVLRFIRELFGGQLIPCTLVPPVLKAVLPVMLRPVGLCFEPYPERSVHRLPGIDVYTVGPPFIFVKVHLEIRAKLEGGHTVDRLCRQTKI